MFCLFFLQWSCKICTFANHPELDECEVCDYPKDDSKLNLDESDEEQQHDNQSDSPIKKSNSSTSTQSKNNSSKVHTGVYIEFGSYGFVVAARYFFVNILDGVIY